MSSKTANLLAQNIKHKYIKKLKVDPDQIDPKKYGCTLCFSEFETKKETYEHIFEVHHFKWNGWDNLAIVK